MKLPTRDGCDINTDQATHRTSIFMCISDTLFSYVIKYTCLCDFILNGNPVHLHDVTRRNSKLPSDSQSEWLTVF